MRRKADWPNIYQSVKMPLISVLSLDYGFHLFLPSRLTAAASHHEI
jgi:hypothetical protein